jgi:hypothetical protein
MRVCIIACLRACTCVLYFLDPSYVVHSCLEHRFRSFCFDADSVSTVDSVVHFILGVHFSNFSYHTDDTNELCGRISSS